MNALSNIKASLQAVLLSLIARFMLLGGDMNGKVAKFARNATGFTQVLVAIVIVAVAVILIMVVAIVISMFTSQIQNNITGLSEEANSTIASVSNAGFGALNLLTVVLYVLAAIAIIGAVMGIFAYIRMKRAGE